MYFKEQADLTLLIFRLLGHKAFSLAEHSHWTLKNVLTGPASTPTGNHPWREEDVSAAREAFGDGVPNTSSGTIKKYYGKYGTDKNVSQFIRDVPAECEYLIRAAYSWRSWEGKLTGISSFKKFCQEKNLVAEIPIDLHTILRYIAWLDGGNSSKKGVQGSTAKVYVSHLRQWHRLAGFPCKVLDDPRVILALSGLGHVRVSTDVIPAPSKRVISLPLIRIYGDMIFKNESLSLLGKLNCWTCVLLAFHASTRGGELLLTGTSLPELSQGLRWNNIKLSREGDFISIHIQSPKVSKKVAGDVIEAFSIPDKRICAVHYIKELLKENKKVRDLKEEDLVFRKTDGSPLLLKDMNRSLMDTLGKKYPGENFSMHGIRAGLVTHVSHTPAKFTAEEEKAMGRWASEAVERYKRNNGITRGAAMMKLWDMIL